MKRLKIVFVIPYFYPAWEYGGSPRCVYELARGLADRGHQIKVLTTDSGGHRRLWDEPKTILRDIDGIEAVYYRNTSNYLAYHHRIFLPLDFFRQVRSVIGSCDVVHIHELRSTLAVPAYKAAHSLSIPYVISPHGGLRRLGKSVLKTAYDLFWGHRIIRDAAALFAISPIEQNDAERLGISSARIRCIPNGIDLEPYTDIPKGEFRNRWRLGTKTLFLFIGRLHWINPSRDCRTR